MTSGGGEDTIPPSTNGKPFPGRWSSVCTGLLGRKELGGLGPEIEQNQGILEREAKPDHGGRGERERNETPMMQTRRGQEEQRP